MNHHFIKGLDLSQLFYEQAVKPILTTRFPNVTYSAALIGRGSEVLGFDTPQSRDHDWGLRLVLFLTEADYRTHREEINQTLRRSLPPEIEGYPANFARDEDGTTWMEAIEDGAINHGVMFLTVRGFCNSVLNFDLDTDLCAIDWLTIPEQILRAITSGRVFHDGLGQLKSLRAKLSYYPRDVWLYLLASQWSRISEEEAFMGRCGQVDDELGSRLVAGRLIQDVMGLCFLMERQYAPYIKWFGTAFVQLDCAIELMPIFIEVLNATEWQQRERALTQAYEIVAKMHNALEITPPMPTKASRFHERPFLVIHAGRFASAIYRLITAEEVQKLPVNMGSVNQFVDSTEILTDAVQFGQLKLMYQRNST